MVVSCLSIYWQLLAGREFQLQFLVNLPQAWSLNDRLQRDRQISQTDVFN